MTLIQNAGDNQAALPANSYHSVFVWQDGNEAFLVASDNTEFEDVDIFDITDPAAPLRSRTSTSRSTSPRSSTSSPTATCSSITTSW